MLCLKVIRFHQTFHYVLYHFFSLWFRSITGTDPADDKLWISGGHNPQVSGGNVMTSEFLHADGTLSAGPALTDIAAKGRFFMIGKFPYQSRYFQINTCKSLLSEGWSFDTIGNWLCLVLLHARSHLAWADFEIKVKRIAHSIVHFDQWNKLISKM